MTRLLMLVEGQSEEIFVKSILKPYLAKEGVFIEGPIVLWTKRVPSGGGFRGGASIPFGTEDAVSRSRFENESSAL